MNNRRKRAFAAFLLIFALAASLVLPSCSSLPAPEKSVDAPGDAGPPESPDIESEPPPAPASSTQKTQTAMTASYTLGFNDADEKDVAVFVPVERITGVPPSLMSGSGYNLYAEVLPVSATNREIVWNLLDAGGVNVRMQGRYIYAENEGSIRLRATVVDGAAPGREYTQDFTITVSGPSTSTPVTGVTMRNSIDLKVGESDTLVATVAPADADNKNLAWWSAAENVAIVNKDGLVTAISAGVTIITAVTEDGLFTAECTVDVEPLDISGITLNKDEASIMYGETITLTASITPVHATNQAMIWSSSDPGVVRIGVNSQTQNNNTAVNTVVVNSGPVNSITISNASAPNSITISSITVTALAWEGEATITVTAMNGSILATCTVTIADPYAEEDPIP